MFGLTAGKINYCAASVGGRIGSATQIIAILPRMPRRNYTLTRNTFLESLGSLTQIICLVLLLALVPYTLFAGFRLYHGVTSWAIGPAGPLVYSMARFIGCLLLIYALWRIRQAALRLRKGIS
jgi:hypothetical protein